MRATFSLTLFTGLLCFHLSLFAQDFQLKPVIRPVENINGSVLGMVQDAQGYLWMATQNGLYKYDGHRYSYYQHQSLNQNSPALNYIECINIDKAGNLWLGTRGAGLDRLDPLTGNYTHFRHRQNDPASLVNDTVDVITVDREGSIWIGTPNGLDRFDPGKNQFRHYTHNSSDPSSISCNSIRAIYEDRQGELWVGTGNAFIEEGPGNEGGLNRLNKKTDGFIIYKHDDKNPRTLTNNLVRAILEDSRGNFWIGTAGDGLHTMNRQEGSFERHLYDPLHPDQFSRPPLKKVIPYGADHITFINEDARGRIWIGTFEGGINVYDPGTRKVSHLGKDKNSKEILTDDNFWTTYKTKDNIIWISTWEGALYKVNPSLTILPHISTDRPVFCFAEDDEQGLWIGTPRGLIHKRRNGAEEVILVDKDTNSQSNFIFYLEKDGQKFWITTPAGLYLFDPVTKSFSTYQHDSRNTNSLSSNSLLIAKKTKDNKLWITTQDSGLNLLDTKSGQWKHFKNNPQDSQSLSNNHCSMVGTDKNQNIWVGTETGINRLDEQTGQFKRYLRELVVYGNRADREGNFWVCTEAGLYKYDEKTDNFLNFGDETSGLNSIFLFWTVEDLEGNLWFMTPKGIIKLNKERTSTVLYGANQGINGQNTTGLLHCRQNGEMLLGDSTGYFQFQPKLLLQNSSAPGVVFTGFLLNNKSVQPSANGVLPGPLMQTREIRLNHNQNTFSFEFSNIDFSSEHADTRLIYMLENYDNTWRSAGEERRAYYFNLPPGKYIFKVKALNAAGLATEKEINLVVTPPWWITWWAYTIFALTFAGLVWAFIAYRSRKLKEQNKILEEKVEQRTHQLNLSLQNLKDTQAQLVQSEKMASLGELTAGIAHEIQNPLNFVNNFSEVNTELIDEAEREISNGNMAELKSIFNHIRENEKKISNHGRRADSIVKGMLLHSRNGGGMKEPTDINSLADEYLRLSYHGLRAKDNSFKATLKTDFDKSIPKINIIPQDISRVLVNLYNNAWYAVAEKSRLQKQGYEPTVTVRTKNAGSYIEIHVADNGNGIPQKVVDKIFQPFFTTKPTGQGTGLGLSMSYDIVKAHGGELKVVTKEGEGSEFIVQIPSGLI